MANLPYTQFPAEPQLKDVLNQLKKNIFLSMNCHHIGTIQSFDTSKQTATATINYKKTRITLGQNGTYNETLLDYPILIDCPVVVLGGAGASLTFPIAAGDECLCLFNDRDMDNWFAGATGSAVATTRQHHFADAILLVGIRSMANVIADYDDTRAVLRNGDALIGVGETLIKIANATQDLKNILQDLVSAIENLQVLPGTFNVSGVPVTGLGSVQSLVPPLLSTINTDIGDLLE